MTEPIIHIPKNHDKPVTIVKKSRRATTKLSVVVPMYNVSLFLREALDSLLRQGVDGGYQVILIDDGSKDATPEIAREYVDNYPEIFELYLFENGGLGSARNRGTNLAEGEFITYVDPDDIVIDFSYRKMLNMIMRTGSDLIGGAVRRFNSTGESWTSYVHHRAYHDTYEATTLAEHPEMVWDSTAWNKIYRLDFILKYSLYFPEKVLYEDMPTVVPMYSLAQKIDIFDEIVYLWRFRDIGAPSITQATGQIKSFTDRVKGMKFILESLKKYDAPRSAQDEQLHKMLDFDLTIPFTYDNYLVLDQDYKDVIYREVKSFLEMLTPQQFNQARFWYRALYTIWLNEPYNLVQQAILTYAKKEFHISFNPKTKQLHSSYQDDFDFELPTFKHDFESRTRLYEVKQEDNVVTLDGHLYYQYLDVNNLDDIGDAEVTFVNKYGETVAPFTGSIVFSEDPNITAYSGFDNTQTKVEVPAHHYQYNHYHIEIPLTDLTALTEPAYIKISQVVHGMSLQAIVTEPLPGDDPRPEGFMVGDDFIVPGYSSDWRLKFTRYPKAPVVISSRYYNNNYIWQLAHTKAHVALWDDANQRYLPLVRQGQNYTISETDQSFLGEADPNAKRWWQLITTDDLSDVTSYEKIRMSQQQIAAPQSIGANMSIFHVSNHVATLAISWEYPIVKSFSVDDNTAKIQFWLGGWTKTALSAKLTFAADGLSNSYRAKKLTHGFGKRQLWEVSMPLSFGQYRDVALLHPEISIHFLRRDDFTMPLRWGKSVHELLNKTIPMGQLEWLISTDDKEEHRQVVLRQNTNREGFRDMADKVAFWQTDYLEYLKQPLLNNTVVYSSLWGDKFGDNPKAIYDYLQAHTQKFNHVVVLKNIVEEVDLPNTKFISFGTKEYWYYLARAKYFVNNVNFEQDERIKRSSQVEIQTMHGTPLKNMGFNVLNEWNPANYERYLRKNLNWDYLTVPSDYVAEVAQDAYRHQAQVLPTGYPRNDALFSRANSENTKQMKQKMGIPTNKKIVLYAPTWRVRGEIELPIDFVQLEKTLDKELYMIIHPHYWNNVSNVPKANNISLANQDFSIEDYYLVSDVMITDYSSTMFDYALLDKPMIFYTYDYKEYVSSRGLNFDFEHDAPGPLVYNQNELLAAINNFEAIEHQYREKIANFKHKFIQYDDGHASQKLVETVFKDDMA